MKILLIIRKDSKDQIIINDGLINDENLYIIHIIIDF